ncbi:MAG: hypothetical protein FJ290_10980 [Planctomycetes bacterium]|nr:hypothetical protein [Planctomycetota bacterium]
MSDPPCRHIVRLWPLAFLCGCALAQAPKQTASAAKLRGLTDKTLVVWLTLANTTQRAGSALTLIDSAERFDAIVFGEVAPGKWMAGSDFFRRTQRDQAAWPAETADGKAVLQLAVAYQGKRITLYRNAKPHASYEVAQPQSFGADATLLIGLRYIGHMGPIGHLAATIEEARVYDVPLDAAALAALQPNKPSTPKPIGLWTFEDGTPDDTMGTFPTGKLCGGARIADGKLHLNGKDAYMIAESVVPESHGMFYRPRDRQTGVMWDTWLFLHKGVYHLYYLAKSGGQWDNISMATSKDGVHWTERGRILAKAEGVTWMGTGSTWKSPSFEKDGKFQMNFSEWRGPRQTIFFAESKDLLSWTRLGNELEFVQDTRWYEEKGRWDCIWTLPREGGGYYGYWTATPKKATGGQFGFGETDDGVTWKALEPPRVHGVGEGEVGAIEKIAGRYYMMFGSGGLMVTLLADRPQGPFSAAKRNFRLLSGHTYFARFLPTPGGLLVNHHSIARGGMVHMGTLKRAVVDKDGTLRLAWWEGNDALKHEAIEAANKGALCFFDDRDVAGGIVLEGILPLPGSDDAKPSGLYIEHGRDTGTAILVNAKGIAEIGPMAADGSGFKAESRIDREMAFGPAPRFRLLLRHSLLEFFLNDILIQCYSLPAPATGRIGLIQGGAQEAARALKSWR